MMPYFSASLFLLFALLPYSSFGFQSQTTLRMRPEIPYLRRTNPFVEANKAFKSSHLLSSAYGRGAEIWPECNEEPIRLSQSFAGGKLPDAASKALEEADKIAEEDKAPNIRTPSQRNKRLPGKIYRLLRRAAGPQEKEASVGLSPAVVGIVLLVADLVQPVDLLWVCFLSGYTAVLGLFAKSPRRNGTTESMPALPPQGHVPALVSNPLGIPFTRSRSYRWWLRTGTLIGLLGPLGVLLSYSVSGGVDQQIEAAKSCARPLFLLCCQAVSEATSRRIMAPLTLRIFIPIAYNILRLGPLWSWAFSPDPLGHVCRGIAVTNLVYWAINLFAFLLPVATVRYMRAHFYCVEAEQVTTRPGFGDSIGLLP